MMTSRANRVGAHSETMIFTRATHKGSLQPISMICPKVAGRSLAESVNLPARCCTLLSSAVKMAELVQQLELLLAPLRPQLVTPEVQRRHFGGAWARTVGRADNLGSHKSKAVRRAIRPAGTRRSAARCSRVQFIREKPPSALHRADQVQNVMLVACRDQLLSSDHSGGAFCRQVQPMCQVQPM